LLLVLGIVIAREIIAELEERVEREQRFVLEALTGYVSEDMLIRVHDLEARSMLAEFPNARTEFVVFTGSNGVQSTISPKDALAWRTIEDLKEARRKPEFQAGPDFRRQIAVLNNRTWLILFRSCALKGPRLSDLQQGDIYHLYPYDEIASAKRRAIEHIISLGMLGLLAAALLGLLMAHWVALPVRRLAAAARGVTSGGLNEKIPDALSNAVRPKTVDEIGELGLAFQTMLETLRRSQNELLKAERLASTGKLAASVAHEIRNPLTSLRMTMQMLQQRSRETDPNLKEGYVIVLREIDRLALAVEELLTFARPRPPRREPVDLNKLVADVLQFLDHQLVHARVKSVAEFDSQLPVEVPLDQNKIRQLLVNLILNAQQAIVRDGTITVKTRWNADSKTVLISVSDTGPGILPEIRDRVFDLFVSTKDGGGGIGLAVAKQVAEEHGGSISFDTSEKGTTFNVTLATA
jgi:signal transduction histidine kinase